MNEQTLLHEALGGLHAACLVRGWALGGGGGVEVAEVVVFVPLVNGPRTHVRTQFPRCKVSNPKPKSRLEIGKKQSLEGAGRNAPGNRDGFSD